MNLKTIRHFAGPVNVVFACVRCVWYVFSQAGSMLSLVREAESWRSAGFRALLVANATRPQGTALGSRAQQAPLCLYSSRSLMRSPVLLKLSALEVHTKEAH